jgi:hypothetical protein
MEKETSPWTSGRYHHSDTELTALQQKEEEQPMRLGRLHYILLVFLLRGRDGRFLSVLVLDSVSHGVPVKLPCHLDIYFMEWRSWKYRLPIGYFNSHFSLFLQYQAQINPPHLNPELSLNCKSQVSRLILLTLERRSRCREYTGTVHIDQRSGTFPRQS